MRSPRAYDGTFCARAEPELATDLTEPELATDLGRVGAVHVAGAVRLVQVPEHQVGRPVRVPQPVKHYAHLVLPLNRPEHRVKTRENYSISVKWQVSETTG